MHRIKVFRNSTFDDYAVARKKAKAAEDTSDLQSEAEVQNHRKSKIHERYVDSGSDDEFLLPVLPSPPKLSAKEELGTVRIDDASRGTDGMRRNSEGNCVIESESPCCSTNSGTNINEKILEQQHLLRALIADVLVRVEAIEKKLDKTEKSPHQKETSIFEQNLMFPASNEEELQMLENYLKDVCELKKFGGVNCYNFVKRVLSTLIADKLGIEYSWLGKKGKKLFHILNVAKLVIELPNYAMIVGVEKKRKWQL